MPFAMRMNYVLKIVVYNSKSFSLMVYRHQWKMIITIGMKKDQLMMI